jgi:hypothetical protein
MNYKCLRCGYTDVQKYNVRKHLHRKKICEPKVANINIDDCLEFIKKKDYKLGMILYEKEIQKLKQVNVLQEIQLENNKLKETIKNQHDEINQLKMSQIPVQKEQSECIYLLLEREFIDKPLKVAKLGRSICFKNRMNQYPKGSPLLCVNKCNDSVKAEKDLLTIFNCMFKQRSDIGDEYFEGETSQMIKQINGYFYNNF